MTFLGDAEFYFLAFPLVYWSLDRRLGVHLGLILLLSAGTNAVLKLAFASPRPVFLDPGLGLVPETSYGIPSGHTQNAVALWGLLGVRRGGWWRPVCAVLIVLLAWSRLQLGVHFPIDVAVGFVVGALLLAAYVRWQEVVSAWFAARRPWTRVAVVLVVSLLLLALAVLARLWLSGTSVPADWVGIQVDDPPYSLEAAVTATATLFGAVAGMVLVEERGGFSSDGAWWRRALRFVVGVVGIAVLLFGFGADPTADGPGDLARRYLQYSLLGVWIGGVAPLLFVRLGLAEARSSPVQGHP